MWGLELSLMAAMVFVNAILAAYEIALASVSVSRLQSLAEGKRRGAAAALRMKQDMEASLAVVQLGITLVGAIAAAVGGAGAEEAIEPYLRQQGFSSGWSEVVAVALVVLPLTAVTIVLGELVPKLFALRNKEWVCLQLSPPMGWFALAVWPAVWALETSASGIMNWSERLWKPSIHPDGKTEAAELQELRAIASLARTARLIGPKEETIIHGAARLSSRPVREIMLPAEHISMLDVNRSIGECLIAAHLDMHTRFPLTERTGDPQSIIGYVNFKDIVSHMRLSPHDSSLRGIVRNIPSLGADVAISAGLEQLMRERTHIALVRDRDQKVLGLITIEDIIEELVGEIHDEYDALPAFAAISGAGWIVGGGMTLTRLRELTGIDLAADAPSHDGARNLSGWVVGHLGQAVRGGEVVERPGVRVVVRKVRRQQVLEAMLTRETAAPLPAGSA